MWVYGQTEVTKDLIKAQLDGGPPLLFEVSDVTPEDVDTDSPADPVHRRRRQPAGARVRRHRRHRRLPRRLPRRSCSRAPGGRVWERTYPYAWLGILADAAPATDELIYAWHPDGFALYSMRSPKVSRLYLQVDPDEKIEDWSDDRIWDNLATRFALEGWELNTGPITEKSVLPMRSFVSAPMRRGRLFLAGDAAHIVPPTGAKGLNLAVADVTLLASALVRLLQEKQTDLVDSYSDRALARVWRCTHFSWFMTSMLHRSGDDFDAELQLSQLRRVVRLRARRPRARRELHRAAARPLSADPARPRSPWPGTAQAARRCSPRPTRAAFASLRQRQRPAAQRWRATRSSARSPNSSRSATKASGSSRWRRARRRARRAAGSTSSIGAPGVVRRRSAIAPRRRRPRAVRRDRPAGGRGFARMTGSRTLPVIAVDEDLGAHPATVSRIAGAGELGLSGLSLYSVEVASRRLGVRRRRLAATSRSPSRNGGTPASWAASCSDAVAGELRPARRSTWWPRVEQPQLHQLVRRDVLDQLHPGVLERRRPVGEGVLEHATGRTARRRTSHARSADPPSGTTARPRSSSVVTGVIRSTRRVREGHRASR